MTQTQPPKTSKSLLIEAIDQFLARNPEMDATSFGWKTIKDNSLVARLKAGGDVTTAKMDAILRYIVINTKKENTNEKS